MTAMKPNSKVRICVDYRLLNQVAVPLPFYMPKIEDIMAEVEDAKVIRKLD